MRAASIVLILIIGRQCLHVDISLRALCQGLRKRTKKELLALHLSLMDQICVPVYEVTRLYTSVVPVSSMSVSLRWRRGVVIGV